ncbi:hypothetical protein FRX31_028135 [Thalictrum thalictroides]|uniref:HMA domain-containing protein n=1 Tax=Thalictrum thalictroides TaxID=46969 RepID=A0A7J6VCD4_THATH|nr:hypothetical protein FRX31_028135 [Thalictrum thalictroides]
MKLVADIEGINSIVADSSKSTLTVVGEADPVKIIKNVRKYRKSAQIVSIGAPPKQDEKKDEQFIRTEKFSMVQKTVLKVNITCKKCQKQLLKAATGLPGVDKIEVDAAKGTLSVTGDADPYKIIGRIKKTKKFIEIVTIGPPPPPPKSGGDQKKPEDPKKAGDNKTEVHAHFYAHHSCAVCDGYGRELYPSCSIM